MKIMLIDDDELTLDIFSKALELNGYACSPFSSPEDAVKAYDPTAYDVVICDYFMPRLTGLETLKLILSKDPGAKVFLYSAQADRSVAQKALSMGAFDFLNKPIDWKAMLRKLQTNCELEQVCA